MASNQPELPATDASGCTTAADVTSRLGELSLDGSDRGRSGQQTIQPSGYTGSQPDSVQQPQKPSAYDERAFNIRSDDKQIAHLRACLAETSTAVGHNFNNSERYQAGRRGLQLIDSIQEADSQNLSPEKLEKMKRFAALLKK
ncbi:uncharacterized protein L203_102280 [Cryptococcus depauperatus CBS 7841]|uniref:Uncharacterized protein n=1 Tax=Cryptococcus depauperatus CBS 7841 TaxID=1295531 RepID=A0A1E3IA77_9TREE|nr:hypothetical protein L203_04736 [Cryptococcus depauperatus CBS 7841]